jgi:hypothetical protein
VTIADTLYDAANDIRGYIEDEMTPSDKLEDEIMDIVAMMDSLREKIDAVTDANIDRIIVSEREFRKSQAQEETTQLTPERQTTTRSAV